MQTARGAVWLAVPSVLAKVVGFFADVALAWFLSRSQFGLVALGLAVTAVFSTIQQAGIRDILTQRQRRFLRWASPGFSLSLTLGAICTVGMAAAAPLAERLFDAPGLKGIVLLLSVRLFLDAVAVVPQAKLQSELRYRTIGLVAAICTLIQAGLSVLLASKWFSLGAYAMCVPMVVTSFLQALLFWLIAKPSLEYKVRLKRWRWLGRDAGFAVATGLVSIAVGYGDSAVLGLFRDEEIVGLYFFAYRLAVQANLLLVGNLTGVIFSALSQLGKDRQRQVRGAMKAAKLLAVVAVPVNLLQAAVAEPLLALLYPVRWAAATVPFQLLSLSMALALVGAPAVALIRAQGRFATFFYWSASLSVVFLALIGIGAAVGGATGVAAAVVVYYGIFGPAGLRLAVGRFPRFWTEAALTFYLPLLLGSAACLAAVFTATQIPFVRQSNITSIVWIVLVSSGIYVILVRKFLPEPWHELRGRLNSLLRRRAA